MAIPEPEHGLVINYAYLWHHEHRQGPEEGRKDKPSVIVMAAERMRDGTVEVTVLPMTHATPLDQVSAVEIPAAVKRHLGLDDQRSWIVVDEGNRFVWPGYDLRQLLNSDHFDYGFLPPRLFATVQAAFVACYLAGQSKLTPRE